MRIEAAPGETAVLIRWEKRTDNYVLVRMKAEAILHASRGVDVSVIADMVERSAKTVRERLAGWQNTRMCPVLTEHAGNQNAAKLTRTQKEDLKAVPARPPSRSGIDAEFRDVPALHDVVKILFDVEYRSDSSYQLLLRFCGSSPELPDPFDEHRDEQDEQAVTRRMAEVETQVEDLPDAVREACAVDGVRLEHGAGTRRMRLPKGQRTKSYADRQKVSQSFFGALSLTDKRMRLYPIEGNQDTEQIIPALERLQRGTRTDQIAVVLDNARFHHAKTLTGLYRPGQLPEPITPVLLPPYAPGHNPVEHVRGHRQGQHREHPARDPGSGLRGIRLVHHWSYPRL